jgi:hypothetical protein
LAHQPDHVLLGLVLDQSVMEVVIAERKLAGMGAITAVLGDAAPFGCQRRAAAYPPSAGRFGGRKGAGRCRAGQGRIYFAGGPAQVAGWSPGSGLEGLVSR